MVYSRGCLERRYPPAFPPEALDKSRFQEDGDNLFQITYGNVLPGGNLLQGNVAFVAVMGEINHQAQRVTSSGGNLHHIG